MKSIIILGSGLVGKVMAADLSKDYDVTVADINRKTLDEIGRQHSAKTSTCDISDKSALEKLIAPYDLVVGAVPGFMGFEMLKTVIEAGKNIVDISFFPEDALELD